jgi:hypothetical protein
MPATTQVPTGESQPTSSEQAPTKRDLASWWKQFKKTNRKDEVKGMFLRRLPGFRQDQ